jgi:hypothetical protein
LRWLHSTASEVFLCGNGKAVHHNRCLLIIS